MFKAILYSVLIVAGIIGFFVAFGYVYQFLFGL